MATPPGRRPTGYPPSGRRSASPSPSAPHSPRPEAPPAAGAVLSLGDIARLREELERERRLALDPGRYDAEYNQQLRRLATLETMERERVNRNT